MSIGIRCLFFYILIIPSILATNYQVSIYLGSAWKETPVLAEAA